MSKVSIVIPFYNCPYINQAIESALNQSYSNTEVIVVNDGSSEYNEKISPYLNHIKYYKKENGGTASALNLGIKNATGDYFAWLSSDDLFKREKISKQLSFMKERDAYISYSNYSLIDSSSNIIHKKAAVFFSKRLEFLRSLENGCIINGSTVMVKMDVFKALGLFNENLKYTQDYDFWLRAVQHYEFYFLNKTLLNYRVHDKMGSNNFHESIENEIDLLKQYYKEKLKKLITEEKMKLK